MLSTPFDNELTRLDAEREIIRLRQRLYRYLTHSLLVIAPNAEWIARNLSYNRQVFTPMEQARLNAHIRLVELAEGKRLALP